MNPKKLLTEENPETPQDFQRRQITEVGGAIQISNPQRVLTEVPMEEDEEQGPQTLLG